MPQKLVSCDLISRDFANSSSIFYIIQYIWCAWCSNTFSKLGDHSSDAAFAMYYGKFQGIAPKAGLIIALVENRLEQNAEYELLLNEIHKMYLTQRAGVSQFNFGQIRTDIFRP